jgi:hypothetical protein
MKRARVVSLAAAIVVTAIQWAAFFSPMLYTGLVGAAGASVADEASSDELPVIVVATHRESFFKY